MPSVENNRSNRIYGKKKYLSNAYIGNAKNRIGRKTGLVFLLINPARKNPIKQLISGSHFRVMKSRINKNSANKMNRTGMPIITSMPKISFKMILIVFIYGSVYGYACH